MSKKAEALEQAFKHADEVMEELDDLEGLEGEEFTTVLDLVQEARDLRNKIRPLLDKAQKEDEARELAECEELAQVGKGEAHA